MDVAGGGEGQVDGAEEQVGRRQADHEQRRRVRTQLRAPQQRHHGQEVAWNRETEIYRIINCLVNLYRVREAKRRFNILSPRYC